MRELSLNEIELVSGGIYGGADGYCVASATFLAVSPLGGPWTFAGALLNAYSACAKDGSDYNH